MKKLIPVLAAVITLGLTVSRAADPTNLGFESGLSGWSDNSGGGLTSTQVAYGIYTPQEGSNFAVVYAGLGTEVPTTLSQTFTLGVGDSLTGYAAFAALDYLPFNDWASVVLSSVAGDLTLFAASVATAGDGNSTSWTPWSYTAVVADTYTLSYNVANGADNSLSSYGVFDASFQKASSSSVPENGSTLGMAVFGLVSLAAVRRRLAKA